MAKRDRNKKVMRNDMGAVLTKGDYERYGLSRETTRGSRKRNRGKRKEALIWQVYRAMVMEGRVASDVAQELGFTEQYVETLYREGKRALARTDEFNPEADDVRRELKKFLPLAATALKKNLMDAEPRVTVAYFQGMGAFVDKQEVVDVTETERQSQLNRAERAFNKRLMEKMKVNAEVTIDEDENDANPSVRTDKPEPARTESHGTGPDSNLQPVPVHREERKHGPNLAETGRTETGAEKDERTETETRTQKNENEPK